MGYGEWVCMIINELLNWELIKYFKFNDPVFLNDEEKKEEDNDDDEEDHNVLPSKDSINIREYFW